MTSVGRYKAQEWAEFEAVYEPNTKKAKQRCKHCESKISSKIERMREHLKKCNNYIALCNAEKDSDEDISTIIEEPKENETSCSQTSNNESNEFALPCTSNLTAVSQSRNADSSLSSFITSTPVKRCSSLASISSISSDDSFSNNQNKRVKTSIIPSIDRFVQKTSEREKKALDLQFARAVYSCNIPFNAVENTHMKKLISMLRHDSYKAPSREQLRTNLLDSVYDECKEIIAADLKGQKVTLIQDGWSNVHNQPLIGTTVHNGTKPFFIRSVDCGAQKKTAEYCTSIAQKEIDYVESTFGCQVIAFCSDSEAKMVLTRKLLQERVQKTTDKEFYVYGCSAHYLNLVETEVSPKTILNKVVEVQKYFRNTHLPAGWLLEKNGVKPQIPNSTRWNSQHACIDTFLKNYCKFVEIGIEHENDINKNILAIINNAGIHVESMHLQKQLKKVSSALDTMQKDDCTLGEAVHVWLDMLKDPILEPYKEIIEKRFDQCVTPVHLVAYQAHPLYKGKDLNHAQNEKAGEWLSTINPNFTSALLSLSIENYEAYPKYMFQKAIVSTLSPGKWWKSIEKKHAEPDKIVTPEFCKMMIEISSLPASSAAIERIFSTFGLIHTKLRNRLGIDRTEKLVLCHRTLKDKQLEYSDY